MGVFVYLALAAHGLHGCIDVADVRRLPPPVAPFDKELYDGYLMLAERSAGERFTSSIFAYKAKAVARGEQIAPESLEDWLPQNQDMGPLKVGRARLTTALVESQRSADALAVAQAQIQFDCWLVASASGAADQTAAQCRDRFKQALLSVKQGLAERAKDPQ